VMGCCLRGETARLSPGSQRRDFVYAEDVAELLDRVAHLPEASGRVFHAGTGRAVRVREAVETILAVCGRGPEAADFGAVPVRPDDPPCNVADITATTALTGWRPRHDLRAGLERTWAWFRGTAARAA
jgi:nucleoside-diphosphate-sugar epimerase